VRRRFRASRPDELHVADFTYVPMITGFGYTAFVVDAYAGPIVGWECSLTKNTAFVERAIRAAAARRAREGHPLGGDTIHHSDYAEVCVKPRMCGDGLCSWGVLADFSA
jgi:putative transposase